MDEIQFEFFDFVRCAVICLGVFRWDWWMAGGTDDGAYESKRASEEQ